MSVFNSFSNTEIIALRNAMVEELTISASGVSGDGMIDALVATGIRPQTFWKVDDAVLNNNQYARMTRGEETNRGTGHVRNKSPLYQLVALHNRSCEQEGNPGDKIFASKRSGYTLASVLSADQRIVLDKMEHILSIRHQFVRKFAELRPFAEEFASNAQFTAWDESAREDIPTELALDIDEDPDLI